MENPALLTGAELLEECERTTGEPDNNRATIALIIEIKRETDI